MLTRTQRLKPSFLFKGALLALSLGAFSACDAVVDPQREAPASALSLQAAASPASKPEPPRLILRTPQYPAAVIYILYREYLHKNPGLTTLSPEDPKYQRYLERRLRQLYPGKGYNGMVKDAVEEHRQHQVAWAEYRKRLREWRNSIGIMACDGVTMIDPETGEECYPSDDGSSDPTVDPSWDGQTEHEVPPDEMIPTLQMEIDTLLMTTPEIDRLYYQESLADGSFYEQRDELIVASTGERATLDDLIRAAGDGWMPPNSPSGSKNEPVAIQVNPAVIATIVVSAAVIGWKAWRIKQAADRAREKSEQFYGHQQYASTQRDAHRHIFFNMQARRYVGAWLTKQIADNHENSGDNPPADWAMDLHNNDIGREVRYKHFRGHWLFARWDWNEWAERIRGYITNSPNAEYIPEWQTNPPTTREAAAAREAGVPDEKYIYFVP